MKNFSVGSTDSSDLEIHMILDYKKMDLINLVPEIEDTIILKILEKYTVSLQDKNIGLKVYYNGADEWVIKSRCESIINLFESENQKMEVQL